MFSFWHEKEGDETVFGGGKGVCVETSAAHTVGIKPNGELVFGQRYGSNVDDVVVSDPAAAAVLVQALQVSATKDLVAEVRHIREAFEEAIKNDFEPALRSILYDLDGIGNAIMNVKTAIAENV